MIDHSQDLSASRAQPVSAASAEPAAAKITADDMRAAMRKRWGSQETNGRTAVLFEVSNSTGFNRSRSADALIMWCWPSDGLELHGVEIKVARSDWMHELRQPKKADDIAKYCDRWWLFTGPGVVRDADELPPAWGWRQWDGKAWKTMKEALRTPAEAIDRPFLGAVLRNAGSLNAGMIERVRRDARDELEAEVERRVERRLSARTPDKMAAMMKTVADFEAATGIMLHSEESFGWLITEDGQEIGRMVAAIRKSKLAGRWDGLPALWASLEGARSVVREAATALGVDLPEAAKPKRGRA